MAKTPYDYVVLRTESVDIGDISLNLDRFADADGKITQIVSLSTVGEEDSFTSKTIKFKLKGSEDQTIDILDKYWNRLKQEFQDIDAETRYYYHAKTGKLHPDEMDSLSHKVLRSMSTQMLNQHIMDESVVNEQFDHARFPISDTNDRMEAIRVAAQDYDVRFDRLEDLLDSINANTSDAAYAFDHAITGPDDHMQPAGQDYDDDEQEQDFREVSDEELDGAEWEEVPDDELYDHGLDDIEVDDEEQDIAYAPPAQTGAEPWMDDDFDPDEERDILIEDSMSRTIKNITDFTNLANSAWEDAVQQITEGKEVVIDATKLAKLQHLVEEASTSYDDFKDVAQQHPSSEYELKAVFDTFENAKDGTIAQMQEALDILSDTQMLSAVIGAKLPAHIHDERMEIAGEPEQASPEQLRNDSVMFDHYRLSRKTTMGEYGKMHNRLKITDDATGELLSSSTDWIFKTGVDPDNHLEYVDIRWDQQRSEFIDIAQYAQRYAQIKTTDEQVHDAIIGGTVADTSSFLLMQYDNDSQVKYGEWDKELSPLLPDNFRFMASRENAYKQSLPMDDFETSLVLLHRTTAHAFNRLGNIVHGVEPDFDPHTDNPGLETGYDDDQDHKKNPTIAGESISWQAGDADSWKKGTEYDTSDKERQARKELNILTEEYIDNMNAFFRAADDAWTHVGQQIKHNEDVTLPEKPLQAMKYFQTEIRNNYDHLNQVIAKLNLPETHLDSVYELLDDEKTGPKAVMQKLISVVSRPELMESTVRKGMSQQRGI